MSKYMIEDVKVGVSEGGFACGPVCGSVVAEVCLRDMDTGKIEYHSLSETAGSLTFTVSEESTYDGQIENNFDDKEFWDKYLLAENGGYTDYNEFYEDLADTHELCDDDTATIWKYLAYMVRADWEDIDQMKAESVGKCLDDITIPVCDAEQDYLDDCEENSES